MKIIKGIVNVILSFFLAVIIIANFAIITFSNTILNKEYIFEKLEENDYYGRVEVDLKNGFEEYIYQSGMPIEIFNDIYSRDMVEADINSVINAIYENKTITDNSENIKTKLKENINKYLLENNINLTPEQNKNINDFSELICNIYKNKINSIESYADNIKDLMNIVSKAEKTVKLTLIVALIFVLLIILFINLSTIYKFFRSISISLFASGILLILSNLYINAYINISNILLFTESLSDLIRVIFNDILSKLNCYGIIFIIIGIAGSILSGILYKKETK